MHLDWLMRKARQLYGDAATTGHFQIESRYRYNHDIESIVAMVPAVIPILLLMIPAILSALERRAREGARLDHQFLRQPGHAAGVPARQAAAVRRRSRC